MNCKHCKNESECFKEHRIDIKWCAFFRDKRETKYTRGFLLLCSLIGAILAYIYLME